MLLANFVSSFFTNELNKRVYGKDFDVLETEVIDVAYQ